MVRLRIAPTLGRVPAEGQWFDAGLSAATVLKHHRVISQALQQAITWRTLTVNSADPVAPPVASAQRCPSSIATRQPPSWMQPRVYRVADATIVPLLTGVTTIRDSACVQA